MVAEDAPLLAPRPRRARDLECGLAQRERLEPAAEQQEQVSLGAEDAGAGGRVPVGGQPRNGGAAGLEALERVGR